MTFHPIFLFFSSVAAHLMSMHIITVMIEEKKKQASVLL